MIYQTNDPIIYIEVEDTANTISYVEITSPPTDY